MRRNGSARTIALQLAMQLPPLNGLRAFEAAARHMSFTKAADELHVTQSAISHQIRALEDRLGIRLFRRLNQALVLTDAGQLLLPSVRDAFERLAAGLDRVMEHERSGVLTISVAPSFASRWLMSRIGRFRERHPDIQLRISISQHEIDFGREADVDLALRHGLGVWEGLRADRFLNDEVFPVCTTEATAASEAGETAMTNGTAVHGAPSPERTTESAASPTIATLLGEIVWLLTQSPAHRHLFLADLEWAVMPALMLRQIHLFRSKGRVAGVALWASVSDEVDARLSSGFTRLAPLDWKSGETLWLVDIIAPFGGTERILEELNRSVLPERQVKFWKMGANGTKEMSTILVSEK